MNHTKIFVWAWHKLLSVVSIFRCLTQETVYFLAVSELFVCLFYMLTHHNPKILRILNVVPDIFWCIIHSHTNTSFLDMIAIFIRNICVSTESHDKSVNYFFCFLTLTVLWATSWLLTLEYVLSQIHAYNLHSTISVNLAWTSQKLTTDWKHVLYI